MTRVLQLLLLALSCVASPQQTELVAAIARGDHGELRRLLDGEGGQGVASIASIVNSKPTTGTRWSPASPLMVAAGLGDAAACALLCERLVAASTSPQAAAAIINRRSWVPNSTPFPVAP